MNNRQCEKAKKNLRDSKVPGLMLSVGKRSKTFYLYRRVDSKPIQFVQDHAGSLLRTHAIHGGFVVVQPPVLVYSQRQREPSPTARGDCYHFRAHGQMSG